MAQDTPMPSQNNPRIDIADALRGFAVMAIILLHCIEHFNFYSFPPVESPWLQFTDRLIWDSLFFTFGGKAYAIFALLFGLTFFIQDNNQAQKGKDFRGRFMWRLVLLFIIGNINAMFFPGEVLVLYSLVGFTLIPVARLSNKHVFIIALILLLQPLEWAKAVLALLNPNDELVEKLSSYYWGQLYPAFREGTFWETLKSNLWNGQMASLTWAWENARIFQTSALFMFGMLIGRTNLLLFSEKNKKTWILVLIGALICFFPLNGLNILLPQFITNKALLVPLGVILKSLANFSFMLILVSSLTWLFYSTNVKKVLLKLNSYGRMSLTNYITQSIIGSLLFFNWGFGLYAKLGITQSLLLGICLFLLHYSFCTWWMKHHKHGPLEYCWKKATWFR